jgi:hypothetical protein
MKSLASGVMGDSFVAGGKNLNVGFAGGMGLSAGFAGGRTSSPGRTDQNRQNHVFQIPPGVSHIACAPRTSCKNSYSC